MSINELIIKDRYEDDDTFKDRKAITLKVYSYNVNPMTAVVIGRMLSNKNKLGVEYEEEIETILSKFTF